MVVVAPDTYVSDAGGDVVVVAVKVVCGWELEAVAVAVPEEPPLLAVKDWMPAEYPPFPVVVEVKPVLPLLDDVGVGVGVGVNVCVKDWEVDVVDTGLQLV
jgi:hypothetical protein